MVTGDTSWSLAPWSLVNEVRDHQHEVWLGMPVNFFNVYVYIWGFVGLRMVTADTLEPHAPASLVIEVRGHHHEVRLPMLINFMYNMSI